MPVSNDIRYASVDELMLDPKNPRLGRAHAGPGTPQDKVLAMMRDWTLEELAVSYLENGAFWVQEALLVVKEELYGEEELVVVEGNRRLAALKYLKLTYEGKPPTRKWAALTELSPPEGLFERVPYLEAETREDVEGFLGFRHVTGIKEWDPPEKAEFIARLIDERGLTYAEVMRRIGSKTPTVRQHYIAYRLALQIDELIEEVPRDLVEERFSVMYLSLRTKGVQVYLSINIDGEPDEVATPVPPDKVEKLRNYAIWMFGNEDAPPLFNDSRRIDDFGRILSSSDATEYLESSTRPNFEVAYRMTGADEEEVAGFLDESASNLELALSRLHLYKSSERVQRAAYRLAAGSAQMLATLPDVQARFQGATKQ